MYLLSVSKTRLMLDTCTVLRAAPDAAKEIISSSYHLVFAGALLAEALGEAI